MVHCPRCGVRLPEEEDARFCPNCGEPLPSTIVEKLTPKAVSLESRVIITLITLIICILVTAFGAISSVSFEESQEMNRAVNELRETIETTGPLVIFYNNFIHSLTMLVPVFGPVRGLYVLYTTGRFIAGLSLPLGVNPLLSLVILFMLPITWMEYIVYSLAISESITLTYSIIKRSLKRELEALLIIIAINAALLLLAAWIEFLLVF